MLIIETPHWLPSTPQTEDPGRPPWMILTADAALAGSQANSMNWASGVSLPECRNVILRETPSLGKTHLATVYFVSLAELPGKLSLAENRLYREIKNFTHPKLLIIDGVGYITPAPTQASMLFKLSANYAERLVLLLGIRKSRRA